MKVFFIPFSENELYVQPHTHGYPEIVWLLEGSCRSQFGGEVLSAREGEAFLIPPNCRHDQRGKCRTLCMIFSVPVEETPQHVEVIDCHNDSFLREWLYSLYRLTQMSIPEEAHALGEAVWRRLNHLRNSNVAGGGGEYPEPVRKALDFIHLHFHEPSLSAAQLSDCAGVSRSYLDLMFRRAFGCSCISWLARYRIGKVKYLLQNPFYNLKEIAERTGFSSENYLIRSFRRQTGVTPGAFRRKITAGGDIYQKCHMQE